MNYHRRVEKVAEALATAIDDLQERTTTVEHAIVALKDKIALKERSLSHGAIRKN